MKKVLLLTSLFALIATLGYSQTDKFWSANTEIRSNITTDKAVARLSYPKEFKLFSLNIETLRQELFSIVGNQASKHSTVISLPNSDGGIEQFEVFEASNFVPELQARYPEIRAYSGKGITDRSATLKLSISPQGIQTMLFRTEKENEFIEAYSKDHTVYAVFKSQRDKGKLPWTCTTEDKQIAAGISSQIANANIIGSSTGELKTMRLAQSCNGEYSNYFGAFNIGQIGLVYAAFNATLTRCNGCYEKDLALHLNLIANSFEDQIIFFDPATDPYTTLANWNNQLQATLTSFVGDANYDIGHMFGASGGGGNAGCIGCVCVAGTKGRGITSPADNIPMGDNFDIDYVVHEVGHQLGGNHTFSHGLEGTGVNKEVGAGITIMGYAGITAYDPAPHSIDIYHEASIAQIQANLATKSCPITTNITANNATPVVDPVSNYTIPVSTPFALTGSATDANPGDVLTYCWEQNDNATTSGANSVASPTKLTGPNWLTFPATTSPTRMMPRLSTILAGLNVTPPLPGGDAVCNIEALSSVSRALNFRLTVRDNHPYSSTAPIAVGQTAFTDMTVTVTNTAGPFQVTSPNTNVSWAGGSAQTITWDVNNTNIAPVNCANVKISLSIDGGTTFPTVLSASTANDGSEVLTIPNTISTTARIKIEAVGNIFFDISNTNFSITGSYDFTAPLPVSITCGTAAAANITLATISTGGYVTPVNLAASGNPAGTTVSYSVNPVTPGNSTVVTLNGINTLIPGTYPITITGTSATIVKTVTLNFIVNPGAGPSIGTHPISQQVCAGLNTNFTVVSATGTGYRWQFSTNGGNSWSDLSNTAPYSGVTTSTLNITGVLVTINSYQYRVIVSGQCGSTTSNTAILTVNPLPTVTVVSSAASICSGSPVTLTAGGANTYTWNAGTTPATGAIVVANPVINTTYTVTGTITITGCSNTASVSVIATPKPTLILTASPFTKLMPGLSTTITATASSATTNSFIYTWNYTGPGSTQTFTGNTHLVNLSAIGTYTVTAADASNLACVSLSKSIIIGDSASTKLFVFPSPNDGRFTISYYTAGASATNKTKQSIVIYDNYGRKVFEENKEDNVTQAYQLHQIDMRRNGSGIYFIVLREANGNKIKTGKVVIR